MGKKTWLAASGMDDRGVYLADGTGSAGGRSASDCSGSDRAGRERSGDFTVKTARAYGQGIQEENLEVEWRDEQGNRKKESMTVDVIEKQLSEKEIETIFSEVRGAIEKEILGENESLKHVDHPLYLREELQEYPVTVRWFSSRPEILDWEGRHGENIREDGEAVTLTAIIGASGAGTE